MTSSEVLAFTEGLLHGLFEKEAEGLDQCLTDLERVGTDLYEAIVAF